MTAFAVPVHESGPIERKVAARADALVAGLRSHACVGDSSQPIVILVCRKHAEDAYVARAAAASLRRRIVAPSLSLPTDQLAATLLPHRHSLALACSEGVAAWAASGVPLRVVGDDVGVLWWRTVELRGAALLRAS